MADGHAHLVSAGIFIGGGVDEGENAQYLVLLQNIHQNCEPQQGKSQQRRPSKNEYIPVLDAAYKKHAKEYENINYGRSKVRLQEHQPDGQRRGGKEEDVIFDTAVLLYFLEIEGCGDHHGHLAKFRGLNAQWPQ